MGYSQVVQSNGLKRFTIIFGTMFVVLAHVWFSGNPPVNAQVNNVALAVGQGFTDVTGHQIVRTSNDRVYIFAAQAQSSSNLITYWTTAAGLPSASVNFNGSASATDTSSIISVTTAYDGATIIHVLLNTQSGAIKDYPFDTSTNTFHSPLTLATDGGTVSGDYIGTGGVAGAIDLSSQLQVAYWSSSKHIVHKMYGYNASTNTLSQVGSSTQVDTAGKANHPAIAVSPANNSVTVAWVSESNSPTGTILARTRTSAGVWGTIETVSTSDAWTSTNAGINIDQGPALVINTNGTKYIAYIQDYDNTGFYGKIHFASYSSSWSDSAVSIAGTNAALVINSSTYTHDPALALNTNGQLYIIGHGPVQTNTNKNMYTMRRNANGTWTIPKLFISGNTFDASPSVKWSAVGNYRPNTYEFAFFYAPSGDYSNTTLYYGRFDDSGSSLLPTATPTQNAPLLNYFTTDTPELSWNRISWATGYQIQVASTNSFALPIAFTATVSSTSLSVTTSTLGNGVYFWHVRAQKADGTWGGWSATQRFEVNGP